MNETARNYLRYVRASLADATRLLSNLSEHAVKAVAISFDMIEQGKFDQHTTRQIFEITKQTAERQQTDPERLWPIRLMVCPRVYARRPEHGVSNMQRLAKVVPVFVYACLGQDGSVSIDEYKRTPVIPREYLEPTQCQVAIGTVDEADTAYATRAEDCHTWTALLRTANELVQKVTDSPLDALLIEQYEQLPTGLVVPQQRDTTTVHIQRLVDLILDDDMLAYPLYEAFVAPAADRELKTGAELLEVSHLHLGHAEAQYGLSLSQRESLLHFLSEEPSAASVLVVDGPPGTGKTTLLLSAVATL